MYDTKQVLINEDNYPGALKNLKDAPKILYYKGILPLPEEKCIAIVGTRRCSPYGQQTALKISGELSDAGAVIVSGLAPGIDTFCHKAVIEKRNRTIAVLGTGIDERSIYPQTNLDLSRKILDNGGCLISELPEGTSGSKFSFPRRNRIISGLSSAIVVIEAKEKSGSLITANYAKKQNRKLLAVPGQIYSENSKGPNKLIREGAELITSTDDILKSLGWQTEFKKVTEQTPQSSDEKLIMESLRDGPLHVDKIIEKTKLNASAVATTLALMDISGKVRSLKANTYSLN